MDRATIADKGSSRLPSGAFGHSSQSAGDRNPQPRSSFWLLILAAVFAIFAAYSNHFHNSFHFDDSHTVVDNAFIRDLHNIPRFFTDATTFSTLPANRTWRPIVSLSLAL